MRSSAWLVVVLVACRPTRHDGSPTPLPSSMAAPHQVVPESAAPEPTTPPAPDTAPTGVITPVVPPSDEAIARGHFTRGSEAFARGDFTTALIEFSTADALAPHAALRFNIARTRERLGDLGGALQEYRAVLLRPDATDGVRAGVREKIDELEAILSGRRPP